MINHFLHDLTRHHFTPLFASSSVQKSEQRVLCTMTVCQNHCVRDQVVGCTVSMAQQAFHWLTGGPSLPWSPFVPFLPGFPGGPEKYKHRIYQYICKSFFSCFYCTCYKFIAWGFKKTIKKLSVMKYFLSLFLNVTPSEKKNLVVQFQPISSSNSAYTW